MSDSTVTRDERRSQLVDLVDTVVTICANSAGVDRVSQATQISVAGTLQQHPENPDRWRVVNTNDTYSYFETKDVWLVNPLVQCPTVVFINIRPMDD
jgi:hypothetical protein